MKVSQVTAVLSLWFMALSLTLAAVSFGGYNPVMLMWALRRSTVVRVLVGVNLALACFGYMSVVVQYGCSKRKEDMAQILAMFGMMSHIGVSLTRYIHRHEAYPTGFFLCYATVLYLILQDRCTRLNVQPVIKATAKRLFMHVRDSWYRICHFVDRVIVAEDIGFVSVSKCSIQQITKEMVIFDEEAQTHQQDGIKKTVEFRI